MNWRWEWLLFLPTKFFFNQAMKVRPLERGRRARALIACCGR
jgi:hypothetical protein